MLGLYLKGVGILTGLIIGAGVFALPYAFAKAGLFWGLIHLMVGFLVILLLHKWYGEVAYYTKGARRLTGYAQIYLGNKAKFIALIITIGSYYGSMLVYGLLGGKFLTNFFDFFNGYTEQLLTIAFFGAGALLSLFNIKRIGNISFYLTAPLIGFIFYFIYIAAPNISLDNFLTQPDWLYNADWFLPYGVWLFSLSGFAALPEVRDLFEKTSLAKFKKVISISLFLSAIFYLLFIFVVLGSSGSLVTEDALSGAARVLGAKALTIGSLIGFFAVFTSYLALLVSLKNIFRFDYKAPFALSWLISFLPPIAMYLVGINELITILSIVGTVGMGVLGVFIIFMRYSMVRTLKNGDKNDVVKEIRTDAIKFNPLLEGAVLVGLISAIVYDLWTIFT